LGKWLSKYSFKWCARPDMVSKPSSAAIFLSWAAGTAKMG